MHRNVKSVRIIKLLLERPDGSWTKYALSKASGASQPYGIKIIRKLEEMGLVDGTRVLNLRGLADHGVKITPRPSLVLEMYHPEPAEFLSRNSTRYAVTTYFAENRITHHLFPTRCDAYVDIPELKALKERILKEGLLGGGNMRFIVTPDEKIIDDARNINGLNVVTEGQLMLDLVKEGGVCLEAFELMVKRYV